MWNNLGDAVQVRDDPGQAEIHLEQPGDTVQVRDEPGQAKICVEQPGYAVQVRDEPRQAEICVKLPGVFSNDILDDFQGDRDCYSHQQESTVDDYSISCTHAYVSPGEALDRLNYGAGGHPLAGISKPVRSKWREIQASLISRQMMSYCKNDVIIPP